ncbi:hypothetical protein [Erythrobacter sp. KY5]|uniref:hypothetical protein n=1 Tax=Erythrobacter sp. KY5 TaxID=2011159 RepID=UPI0013A6EA88|nr:hypothetical protein [Erythrobacter sp. KY5]
MQALRKAMMIAVLSCSFAATVPVSANEGWQNVPLNEETFDLSQANSASFETRDGRDALCIDGEAFLRGVSLANGSVAVDIANNHHRHFANLIFRAASQDDYETAYLRMHKSGQFDAVQYTPHLNGETNWQLFREAQARVDFGETPWITLTVDFADDRARIRVGSDSEQPALETVLTLPAKEGGLGLRTLFEGCFSNFRYTAQSPAWATSDAEPPPSPPAGTIERWSLSDAFPMERWAGISEDLRSSLVWSTAEAEPNGRLLISRYRRKATSGDFERNQLDGVYAGVAIHSPNAQTAAFQFDASDMATVWLNGEALVAFDNSFRAKGPLHRGDFDATKQTVALPLREGRNELVVLVAERANGWGLGGSVQADGTLRIKPLDSD